MASTCSVRFQFIGENPHLLTTPAVSSDDQVKAYIKKIMSQLNKWMLGGKISKLVVVITSKETGEHVERWQFDVNPHNQAATLVLTLAGPNLRQIVVGKQTLQTHTRQRKL